jgi:hypothetical protein
MDFGLAYTGFIEGIIYKFVIFSRRERWARRGIVEQPLSAARLEEPPNFLLLPSYASSRSFCPLPPYSPQRATPAPN